MLLSLLRCHRAPLVALCRLLCRSCCGLAVVISDRHAHMRAAIGRNIGWRAYAAALLPGSAAQICSNLYFQPILLPICADRPATSGYNIVVTAEMTRSRLRAGSHAHVSLLVPGSEHCCPDEARLRAAQVHKTLDRLHNTAS